MFIKYKWIEISNFMSFGSDIQRFNLDKPGMTIIIGDNRDVGMEGVSRNGVGKTNIMNAVLFALFGEGLNDIKIDEYINLVNKKKMMVSLCFEVDDNEYIVTRKRKPNSITITVNGEPFTHATTKNEDEAIRSIIGMDIRMFKNTHILTNSNDTFVRMKRVEQKNFTEQLFTITQLTERAGQVKEINKGVKAELTNILNERGFKEQHNQKILQMLSSLKVESESWATKKNEKIKELEHKKKVFSDVDTDLHRRLDKEIRELKEKLSELGTTIEQLGNVLRTNTNNLATYNKELEMLRDSKCPRCHQEWHSEVEILSVEGKIFECNTAIEKVKEPLKKALTEESELKTKLESILSEYPTIMTEPQIEKIEAQLSTIDDQIKQLQQEDVNPYLKQIEELSSSVVDLSEFDEQKNDLERVAEHCSFLVKILTDSKSFVRKSIIDKFVPLVNQYVNNYLQLLGSPNIFTMNNDLSIDIGYMGRTMSIGGLSTGEKIRMSFALSMAFRNFLALTGTSSNLLMIDEIFDSGTDPSGYYALLKILKKLDMSVFIITHQDWIIPECDYKATIVKEDGFTTINQ